MRLLIFQALVYNRNVTVLCYANGFNSFSMYVSHCLPRGRVRLCCRTLNSDLMFFQCGSLSRLADHWNLTVAIVRAEIARLRNQLATDALVVIQLPQGIF